MEELLARAGSADSALAARRDRHVRRRARRRRSARRRWFIRPCRRRSAQAADDNAFPDQIAEAGLKPWQVKRVYAGDAARLRGTTTCHRPIRAGAWAARWPTRPPSRGDCCKIASRSRRRRWRFGRWPSNTPQESDRRDFFGGLAIPPGSQSRRELPPPSARTPRRGATHGAKTPPRPGDSRTCAPPPAARPSSCWPRWTN